MWIMSSSCQVIEFANVKAMLLLAVSGRQFYLQAVVSSCVLINEWQHNHHSYHQFCSLEARKWYMHFFTIHAITCPMSKTLTLTQCPQWLFSPLLLYVKIHSLNCWLIACNYLFMYLCGQTACNDARFGLTRRGLMAVRERQVELLFLSLRSESFGPHLCRIL